MIKPASNILGIIHKAFNVTDFSRQALYKDKNAIRLGLSEGAREKDAMAMQAKDRIKLILDFLLNNYGGDVLIKLTTEDKSQAKSRKIEKLINHNINQKLLYSELGKDITVHEYTEDGVYHKEEHVANLRWLLVRGVTSDDLAFMTDGQIELELLVDKCELEITGLYISCIGEMPWVINLCDDRGCDIISESKELLETTANKFRDFLML